MRSSALESLSPTEPSVSHWGKTPAVSASAAS